MLISEALAEVEGGATVVELSIDAAKVEMLGDVDGAWEGFSEISGGICVAAGTLDDP